MLTSLGYLNAAIYEYNQDDGAEKLAHKQALADFLLIPSTVRSARMEVCQCKTTISLPERVAWSLVEKFELTCFIDTKFIYAILARLPKLRYLGLRMKASYVNDMNSESAEHPDVRNTSVSHLVLGTGYGKTLKGKLGSLLTRILPLVPSLLKLEMDGSMAQVAKEIVADPDRSFEWISHQLEIAEKKEEYI